MPAPFSRNSAVGAAQAPPGDLPVHRGRLPKGLSVTTGAPLTTAMELLMRPKTRETIIHFINFDPRNELAPFPLTLRKQLPGRVKSVLWISPQADFFLVLMLVALNTAIAQTTLPSLVGS